MSTTMASRTLVICVLLGTIIDGALFGRNDNAAKFSGSSLFQFNQLPSITDIGNSMKQGLSGIVQTTKKLPMYLYSNNNQSKKKSESKSCSLWSKMKNLYCSCCPCCPGCGKKPDKDEVQPNQDQNVGNSDNLNLTQVTEQDKLESSNPTGDNSQGSDSNDDYKTDDDEPADTDEMEEEKKITTEVQAKYGKQIEAKIKKLQQENAKQKKIDEEVAQIKKTRDEEHVQKMNEKKAELEKLKQSSKDFNFEISKKLTLISCSYNSPEECFQELHILGKKRNLFNSGVLEYYVQMLWNLLDENTPEQRLDIMKKALEYAKSIESKEEPIVPQILQKTDDEKNEVEKLIARYKSEKNTKIESPSHKTPDPSKPLFPEDYFPKFIEDLGKALYRIRRLHKKLEHQVLKTYDRSREQRGLRPRPKNQLPSGFNDYRETTNRTKGEKEVTEEREQAVTT